MNKTFQFVVMIIGVLTVLSLPAFAGVSVHAAPEPSTLVLVATGVGAVAIVRQLRSK